MEFGIQFFPSVGPETVPADRYFADALELVALAEPLGFTNVRTVEHYFHPYGGYSPNPMLFLSAAAARTQHMRLITGAVLPAFNHPLKLAGEIGMLDAISGGRLEVGFARAFLPHEFRRFGVDLDSSRARFDEGVDVVGRLLSEEDVAFDGAFHQFGPTTSLPRPMQQPRPPFWIAALATEESFVRAGQNGHSLMAIPLAGGEMEPLLRAYRDSWRAAGHPGNGKIMLAFHMLCHEDEQAAHRLSRDRVNAYLASLVDAARDWIDGASSADYPGYDKIIKGLEQDSYDRQLEMGGVWVGTPDTIAAQIDSYSAEVGDFEIASMQVNFFDLPLSEAARSLELFGREVIPRFSAASTAAVS
jgi:alkanesulfonate monooxygenase SsuD/methylene tetrahydromethanopterin reductase-like flavin-dependent oxidoreductase (luciferase family)